MAKRRARVVPARKEFTATNDDSLLIRSAESLGRIIGSLQRQVMDRSQERSSTRTVPKRRSSGRKTSARKSATRKTAASRKRTSRKTSKKR